MSATSQSLERYRFGPGQVWSYQTREGEESSYAVVWQVDEVPGVGLIAHVGLFDLAIQCRSAEDGCIRYIAHLPIQADTLEASLREVQEEGLSTDAGKAGCTEWRRAYEMEGARAWTMPLAEIVQCIEDGLVGSDG